MLNLFIFVIKYAYYVGFTHGYTSKGSSSQLTNAMTNRAKYFDECFSKLTADELHLLITTLLDK